MVAGFLTIPGYGSEYFLTADNPDQDNDNTDNEEYVDKAVHCNGRYNPQ